MTRISLQRFNASTLHPYQGSCPGSLVVSIHDVAPSTQMIVQEMLDDLKQLGVSRCSLLVVPHYHEKELLTMEPSFVMWIREKQQEDHEIVLHGWSHLRPVSSKEGLWKRWMTQHYTRGEGEFYDLSYNDAREKLKKGKEEFEKAGFTISSITGFIAPAWLLSQEAERALGDEHFSYTTRLHGVIDLRKNPPTFLRAQSMVYSVSAAWRRFLSLGWNEFLFQLSERQAWPLLRLGLHPPDWKHSVIRKHALATVSKVMKRRVALTYANWIRHLGEH